MRSVAFLRGINVGGHRVAKESLIEVFEQLGSTDVTTVQASGNVIFTGRADETVIADALEATLGYAVPTITRTAEEVQRIADVQPFPTEVIAASAGKLQVVLWKEPFRHADELLALATHDDRIAVLGREAYWLPERGVSGSVLKMDTFLAFGTNTMRTIGTIAHIVAKL